MAEDKKLSNETKEIEKKEEDIVIENAEDTVCSPEFPSGCIDVEQ